MWVQEALAKDLGMHFLLCGNMGHMLDFSKIFKYTFSPLENMLAKQKQLKNDMECPVLGKYKYG